MVPKDDVIVEEKTSQLKSSKWPKETPGGVLGGGGGGVCGWSELKFEEFEIVQWTRMTQ